MSEVAHAALLPLQVDIDQLRLHPGNANKGDVETITESIAVNGLYRPVVYQRSTGFILAGNHTWLAAKQRGLTHIPAVALDVDDDAATRILLVDNRARDKATWDHEALAALLDDLDDLAGTGYSDADANDLLKLVAPPDIDDLVKEVGDWNPAQTWPTVKITCPPEVASAWEDHARQHGGDGAGALAALLGVEMPS